MPLNLPDPLAQRIAPLTTWASQRRFGVIILVVAGLAVLFLGSWLVRGLGSSPQPEYSMVATTETHPAFASTYPSQIFTAKPVPRAVNANNPEGLVSTFRALTDDEIKNPKYADPSISASSAGVVKDRQYLAQHGYSWTSEGFLSAARKGDLEALKTYLRAGMSVDSRNAFSSTALHAAAETNNLEAAKLLISAGANLNLGTTNLQTPLHRAVAQSFPAMTQLLLLAGANPKSTTLEGWTPLFYAVDNNNQVLTEILFSAGSSPNAVDRFGNTPLMLAVRKNYITLAARLITLGAKVNAADLSLRTPLHYAVAGGYYQLTKMLLENGAKADARDRTGMLPMDIALANQDLALANLLLANGSKRPQTLGTKVRGAVVPPPSQMPARPKAEQAPRQPTSDPKNYKIQ